MTPDWKVKLRSLVASPQKLGEPPATARDLRREPAALPRVLWVELTSRCPLNCVFCLRRGINGDGREMDFDLYRSLLAQLEDPDEICLNHSGESMHYPLLGEAIRLAKATGARTELVSSLCTAPEAAIRSVLEAGLDCLRVSLHTLDDESFRGIYRGGSLAGMKRNIERFLAIRQETAAATQLDFAFVAMERNTHELPEIARYAASLGGVRAVNVNSVLQPEIANHAFGELQGNRLAPSFRSTLRAAIERARSEQPQMRIHLVNPDVMQPDDSEGVPLQETPAEYARPLPDGGRIFTCAYDPCEGAVILADGGVAACGEIPDARMGSLRSDSLRDIWHGPRFTQFREGHAAGTLSACRRCPCKVAYRPGVLSSELRGNTESVQFVRGWYPSEPGGIRWSRPEAMLALPAAGRHSMVLLSGVLPSLAAGPQLRDQANTLEVRRHGEVLARIQNSTREHLCFQVRFDLDRSRDPHPSIEYLSFRTRSAFCPAREQTGADIRRLGFALSSAEVRPA